MRYITIICACFLFAFLAGCGESGLPVRTHSGHKINAELAVTPEQVETGLMHRTKLNDRQGMFFVFPETAMHYFWMKNTLIPLDIIFISEDKQILCIYNDVPASTYEMTDEEVAVVACPAKYVLEIPGGAAERLKIKEGEFLDFNYAA